MSLFFTSDQHFGHNNVIDFCDRPFSSSQEMNEVMIQNFNSVVKYDDTTIIVGDAFLGNPDAGLDCLARLAGTKILVPGNHDKCFVANKNYKLWSQRYIEQGSLSAIVPSMTIQLGIYTAQISHFPIAGNSRDLKGKPDRWTAYRPSLKPTEVLLHGHVHHHWLIDVEKKSINVGVDMWGFYPVPSESLIELFQMNHIND